MSKKQKKERSLFHKSVNGFIISIVAILAIFTILFGFSQTKTFRDYLRDTITETVNESVNGQLSIRTIEGSIFTSVRIKDIALQSKYDTILTASQIELNINPVQLLLKKIYLRNFSVENLDVALREIEKDKWNIGSLSKPDSVSDTTLAVSDTSKVNDDSGGFPFIIQANDIKLTNLNFTVKSHDNLNSTRSYKELNYDDLSLTNLNMRAKALLNPAENEYQLILNSLGMNVNVDDFDLKNLSGAFQISEQAVSVRKLSMVTDSTDLSIDLVIQGLNLFKDVDMKDFKDYPTELSIKAKPFVFNDLAVFLPSTKMLHGPVNLDMQAGGFFGNLLVDNLLLDFRDSHFDVSGYVSNLHTPGDLMLDLQFSKSSTNIRDAAALLPELDLPKYKTLDLSNFDMSFKGSPINFKTVFNGNIKKGKLEFDADLDFSQPLFNYAIQFNTDKLNISELVNEKSLLNAKGKLEGRGVDPTKISAKLVLDSFNSTFNGYKIDSLHLDVDAKAKVFQLDINGLVNRASTDIAGKLDLTDGENPVYDLKGSVQNLDLSEFTVDTSYISLLNFNFTSDGKGLDLDEMTGEFNLEFDQSIFKTTFFEDASIYLSLDKEGNEREINLLSDFMDFSISGEFSLQDAIELLAYQAEQTSGIISTKLDELNPISSETESISSNYTAAIDTSIINNDFEFNYDFEFKDFELIALLIGEEELGIAGTGGGSVKNSSDNFAINTNLMLDYFYTLNNDEILYLSNLETTINFTRDNQSVSFDNLFGALSVSSDRIVAGSIVKNFTADFVFNQSKLIYNVYTEIDTFLTSSFDGQMQMRPGNQNLEISEAIIDYKDVQWRNRDLIEVEFSPDSIMFNKFRLYNDSAFVDVNGLFTSIGKLDMLIKAGKISGDLLAYYTLGQTEAGFKAETNFSTSVKGSINDPKVSLDFRVNDITINERNLGSLYCLGGYINKNMEINFKFIDSTYNLTNPYFQLSGDIPINLAPSKNEKVIDPERELNLMFKANEFNPAALGNIIPTMNNQTGLLSGQIKIGGTFDDLNTSGKLRLKQFTFLSELNNLQYKAGLILDFNDDVINVDSLAVSNLVGSRLIGTVKGTGYAKLNADAPTEINMKFTGGLAVLGFRSRAVSKQVYGNLYIDITDEIEFFSANNQNRLTGSVNLKGTDITFTPLQTGYSSANEIDYTFKVDSSKIDKEKIKFDKLFAKKIDKNVNGSKSRLTNFDYRLNVGIDNEAKIDFILSPEFNQKLSVLASGRMRYESVDGQPVAQGEFKLLDGSKLEFFKVFEAEGSIRFETEVTNPYLDILATYRTDWYQSDAQQATPVAVKINIEGNFNNLGKNLSTSTDNIQVYVGSNNISNNVPDLRYDARNALSFILVSKPDFVGTDVGSTGQNLVTETSYSILGSALTSLVNSRIGEAINDIKLSRNEKETRFNVSGRIENIRYTVGGAYGNPTSNDLDPNLKIEYLFDQNFIIRVERKPPINATFGSTEKIYELGLKYIFVF